MASRTVRVGSFLVPGQFLSAAVRLPYFLSILDDNHTQDASNRLVERLKSSNFQLILLED